MKGRFWHAGEQRGEGDHDREEGIDGKEFSFSLLFVSSSNTIVRDN